jgi:hypothetical protein
MLTPGAAGPPDSGIIAVITQTFATAGGMPLASASSMCQMVNSGSGAPYMLPIAPTGCSTGVTLGGQGLVRMGDQIPCGPGILVIIGPPAAPYISDTTSP